MVNERTNKEEKENQIWLLLRDYPVTFECTGWLKSFESDTL